MVVLMKFIERTPWGRDERRAMNAKKRIRRVLNFAPGLAEVRSRISLRIFTAMVMSKNKGRIIARGITVAFESDPESEMSRRI